MYLELKVRVSLRALAPRGFFAAGLNNAERAVAASTSYQLAAHARLCLMLRRVHGLGWPMQQNGQTDRSSIVSRLQAVVGKDRLVMCIKQCLPEAASHQVRTGLIYTAIGAALRPRPSSTPYQVPRGAHCGACCPSSFERSEGAAGC
jgi:hypothetical protein